MLLFCCITTRLFFPMEPTLPISEFLELKLELSVGFLGLVLVNRELLEK